MSNKRFWMIRGVGLLSIVVLCAVVAVCSSPKTQAGYESGKLIDDAQFLDSRSMSLAEVQSFLVSKNSGLKNQNFPLPCYEQGSRERQLYTSAGGQCDTPRPASEVIYYSAQVYGVSPKVILATLQKEQSLITSPNPTSWQLNQAMGYACPTSGSCDGNSAFPWQIDNGTWALRYHYERANGNFNWWNPSSSWTCGTEKNLYKPNLYPRQNVDFYDTNGTKYTTVYIQNPATSAFYCYTPHVYNNPQGLYGRAPYGTTGLYYSGSYNFISAYESWFGSSIERYMIDGLSYTPVFDPVYYLANYPDVKSVYGDSASAAFSHFTKYGLVEGRQANAVFNVTSYKNANQDLRIRFRNDLPAYYRHFAAFGKSEGRISSGPVTTTYITSYKGTSYSPIYDYTTYLSQNPDLQKLFAQDDAGAIEHFVEYGMKEGRNASLAFNVNSYIGSYYDLRRVFGDDLTKYYLHYLFYGRFDGRTGVGAYVGGEQTLNATNFSDVYNFDYYRSSNPDILTAYKLDDLSALKHFVYFGMTEGRKASQMFDVAVYKNRYPDLQKAFGNNLKSYYLHYLFYGKKEGRTAI